MSFPSGSHSTVKPFPNSASHSSTFTEPPFTLLEEEDKGDFQATFFSSFAHPSPCEARGVEPFMSFEDHLRQEATLGSLEIALEIGSMKKSEESPLRLPQPSSGLNAT